jgi:hypothetical protein
MRVVFFVRAVKTAHIAATWRARCDVLPGPVAVETFGRWISSFNFDVDVDLDRAIAQGP